MIPPVTVNRTMFNFSRLSVAEDYPFITKVVISPVYDEVNGTEVSCRAVGAIITAVIHVIGGKTLNINRIYTIIKSSIMIFLRMIIIIVIVYI